MACKYSKIFGDVNKGIHSYRLFGIAIFDLLLTIIIAIAISWWLKIHFLLVFVALMLLGIVLHRLFCVNTTVNKAIFGIV